ncbi:MAG: hypothetical protein DRQ24_05580, partial [Candidatus Latescibacterota bacterium]
MSQSVLPKPENRRFNELTVQFDPRIELVSIILCLTDYHEKTVGGISHYDDLYYQRAMQHFGKYRDHEAVVHAQKMVNDWVPDGNWAMWALKLDKNLNLTEPGWLIDPKDENTSKSFLNAAKDFAETTHFNVFYEQSRTWYNSILEEYALINPGIEVIREIENFYRMGSHPFRIILAALLSVGAHKGILQKEDNQLIVNAVISRERPLKSEEGRAIAHLWTKNVELYFAKMRKITKGRRLSFDFSSLGFRFLLFHEFSHSFVNPALEKFSDRVSSLEPLFTSREEILRKYTTASIEAMIIEMVIRSFEVFELLKQGEEEQAANKLKDNINQGYFLSVETLALLKEYARMKEQYK